MKSDINSISNFKTKKFKLDFKKKEKKISSKISKAYLFLKRKEKEDTIKSDYQLLDFYCFLNTFPSSIILTLFIRSAIYICLIVYGSKQFVCQHLLDQVEKLKKS